MSLMPPTVHPQRARRTPATHVAAWAAPAGFSLLVLTILFLMGLVIAGTMGHPIPCSARGLVVFVMALTTGASAGFLTGSAKAEGKIPFGGGNVMQLAASGAIATIVIVLLAGFRLYAVECSDPIVTDPGKVTSYPPVTDHEKVVAQRYWETAFAGDWNTTYKLFPSTVQQNIPFPEFIKIMARELSQFSGPPVSRHLESSNVVSGTLILAGLADFDQVSTFRELLQFQRVDNEWAPWSAAVNPVEWPQSNNYRFVTASPSQMLANIAQLPQGKREAASLQQYEGKYIQPPGWSLIVAGVGSKAGDRTCDVSAHEPHNEAVVILHKVLGGCALGPGSSLDAVGRITAVDQSVHVEAVRFWK